MCHDLPLAPHRTQAVDVALPRRRSVTLAVPWLHPREQALVFPGKLRFDDPQAQERHIRLWLAERGGVRADFRLRFYPASNPPTQTR